MMPDGQFGVKLASGYLFKSVRLFWADNTRYNSDKHRHVWPVMVSVSAADVGRCQ